MAISTVDTATATADTTNGTAPVDKENRQRTFDHTPTVTILIPCYNEEAVLPVLFDRLDKLRSNARETADYRFMFVDDGSKDATRDMIADYADGRNHVDFIILSRNFGKEQAMLAGIDAIDSDAMAIIDADLQDPPELIPDMVDLWLRGYDDVYARRRTRRGESLVKRATSHLYYRVLQAMSPVSIQVDTGDFRLLDRKCILALRRLRETGRNSKALFSWIGFRKIEFLYDRDARAAGKSKWSYPKLIGLAMDGIMSFSTAPLRIAFCCGLAVSVAALAYAVVIIARTLVYGVDVPGYASLLVVVLTLGGIQLLALGIIGEYLGRVFTEVKRRPGYLVQEARINNEYQD
ncbi:glycosyltransferase family 2 protein [Bifidobacterium sp. 64T4]|uniref:glycosyltransferase family 2 protein n=1 Tax=Bifidobacterium pongonis TaxID=2834432 RepID=UPI001C55A94B|nr:glycosyltransferase family 2 protein [Bifidobacterium pongonis]MBW3094204.1 glycosyltransferase family 2 protein [Bifidobacterium pongonis]